MSFKFLPVVLLCLIFPDHINNGEKGYDTYFFQNYSCFQRTLRWTRKNSITNFVNSNSFIQYKWIKSGDRLYWIEIQFDITGRPHNITNRDGWNTEIQYVKKMLRIMHIMIMLLPKWTASSFEITEILNPKIEIIVRYQRN